MTSNNEPSKKGKSSKPKTSEEILMGFQKLRSEQRFLTTKLSEMELELQEHRIVIDALKDIEGDRKCYRMIGGILCERTVKDVLPILKTNEENLVKVVESFQRQLVAKGSEINKYKEDNNVKFKHIDELNDISDSGNAQTPVPENSGKNDNGSADGSVGGDGGNNSGVLVS